MRPGFSLEGPRPGVICLYFPTSPGRNALEALGEACLRLTTQVALRGEEAVFIETGASRLLYSEESLGARLLALSYRFKNPARGAAGPRLGRGPHAAEALAQAKYGQAGGGIEGWPLEALECYAAPFFEDAAVGLHMKALTAALGNLGVRDVGGFLALSAQGWGERFGPNAAVLRERLEGRMSVGWPRFEPARRLQEAQDLRDVETQSTGVGDEALRFHLKRLCDRVAARLRGRALRAAALALELRFERVRGLPDAAPWVLDLKLSLPVAEPSQLLKLMQERLEGEARRRRLPRALEGLALAVTATAPGFHAQRDAFDRHEDEAEARNGLLTRLAQRLGEGRVFTAELKPSHDPERAWQRRPPQSRAAPAAPRLGALSNAPPEAFPRESAASRVPRPTRLLRQPRLLVRKGDWLLHWAGADKARRWRSLDWTGPERISGEWWRPALGDASSLPKERDYWRVGTAEGGDLWIFCRQGEETRSGALWLQGWWA